MVSDKPNGKDSSRTLPFKSRQPFERASDVEIGWRAIGFSKFHPSVDPNVPPAYLIEIQGQRTDGVVFTVKLALDKRKIDMIPSPELALGVCRDAILNGLTQLHAFKDCACTAETSCKAHQTH